MPPKDIPERWEPYIPIGSPVRGTRFIAFKVPLKEHVCAKLPPKFRWTVDILCSSYPDIGMIIDLTLTTRYYDFNEVLNHGVDYCKIPLPGQKLPPESLVRKFFSAIDFYLDQRRDDSLIGVHCTHGVNRTGYMIARYLIQRMGYSVSDALESITVARGHPIERENYVSHLGHNTLEVAKMLDASDIRPGRPRGPPRAPQAEKGKLGGKRPAGNAFADKALSSRSRAAKRWRKRQRALIRKQEERRRKELKQAEDRNCALATTQFSEPCETIVLDSSAEEDGSIERAAKVAEDTGGLSKGLIRVRKLEDLMRPQLGLDAENGSLVKEAVAINAVTTEATPQFPPVEERVKNTSCRSKTVNVGSSAFSVGKTKLVLDDTTPLLKCTEQYKVDSTNKNPDPHCASRADDMCSSSSRPCSSRFEQPQVCSQQSAHKRQNNSILFPKSVESLSSLLERVQQTRFQPVLAPNPVPLHREQLMQRLYRNTSFKGGQHGKFRESSEIPQEVVSLDDEPHLGSAEVNLNPKPLLSSNCDTPQFLKLISRGPASQSVDGNADVVQQNHKSPIFDPPDADVSRTRNLSGKREISKTRKTTSLRREMSPRDTGSQDQHPPDEKSSKTEFPPKTRRRPRSQKRQRTRSREHLTQQLYKNNPFEGGQHRKFGESSELPLEVVSLEDEPRLDSTDVKQNPKPVPLLSLKLEIPQFLKPANHPVGKWPWADGVRPYENKSRENGGWSPAYGSRRPTPPNQRKHWKTDKNISHNRFKAKRKWSDDGEKYPSRNHFQGKRSINDAFGYLSAAPSLEAAGVNIPSEYPSDSKQQSTVNSSADSGSLAPVHLPEITSKPMISLRRDLFDDGKSSSSPQLAGEMPRTMKTPNPNSKPTSKTSKCVSNGQSLTLPTRTPNRNQPFQKTQSRRGVPESEPTDSFSLLAEVIASKISKRHTESAQSGKPIREQPRPQQTHHDPVLGPDPINSSSSSTDKPESESPSSSKLPWKALSDSSWSSLFYK